MFVEKYWLLYWSELKSASILFPISQLKLHSSILMIEEKTEWARKCWMQIQMFQICSGL